MALNPQKDIVSIYTTMVTYTGVSEKMKKLLDTNPEKMKKYLDGLIELTKAGYQVVANAQANGNQRHSKNDTPNKNGPRKTG